MMRKEIDGDDDLHERGVINLGVEPTVKEEEGASFRDDERKAVHRATSLAASSAGLL